MFVGVVGAVAFSAPAGAHHPIITYKVDCGPTATTAFVTWEVGNSENFEAELSAVQPSDGIGAIKDRAILPSKSTGTKLTGRQRVNIADGASLSMTVTWHKRSGDVVREASETADLSGLVCAGVEVDFRSKCDGSVQVKLKNPRSEGVTFTIVGSANYRESVPVAAGAEVVTTVPAANAATVVVKVGDRRVGGHQWERPDNCGRPELTSRSDCDNLIITIANPADGRPVHATVTVGDEEKTLDVAPGETEDLVLAGAAGLVATVRVGNRSTEVTYTKPANCDTPGLPLTGANTGLIAGTALLLVGSGAGLFLAARRRRIRFAA
jgi:hypothetical protein